MPETSSCVALFELQIVPTEAGLEVTLEFSTALEGYTVSPGSGLTLMRGSFPENVGPG